jgi:hypothetical protein
MGRTQRSVRHRARVHCVKVVLFYSHRDERLREQLQTHLSALRRSDVISTWHDRMITPGADLDSEILLQLGTADLVLLLVSPDFVNSDYCYCTEMGAALRRHEKGGVSVIPIILRPVDWAETPFGKLLALPRDGKAVTTWTRRDVAFLDVAKGVRRAAEQIALNKCQRVQRRAEAGGNRARKPMSSTSTT